MNVEQNYIDCNNTLAAYLNSVFPLFIARLEEGFKVKSDYSLYKKDSDDIKAIFVNEPYIRTFLQVSEYSIYLDVDHTYQTGEYSCTYLKRSIWVGDGAGKTEERRVVEFKPLTLKSMASYKANLQEYKQLQIKESELKRKLAKLKLELDI